MPDRVPLDLRSLTAPADLFRLSGGSATDPAVAAWFAEEPAALRALALHWFKQLKACGDDVVECLHDGCPVACVDDAPFGYVNTFTRHVNVGFFRGAELPDPDGLLQGSGRLMRHVSLRPGEDVKASALADIIRAAYANIRSVGVVVVGGRP